MPAGERSKSEDALTRIYDWMVEQRLERGSTVVALGGGVAGDLAGYAAATFLRGVPLVHVPTSLLAMTDSAIGGKVAINHPRAKNLIGAFYQPRLVLSDVETLTTLPARELASGWAETIKHGMIMDPELLDVLEGDLEKVLALDPEMTTEIVKRSSGLKGKVVSGDEKEAGWRIILNFGHTIGHALEAATEYGTLLHGEAVSIGAVGAARLSREHAGLGDEVVDRLTGLLKRFGAANVDARPGCRQTDRGDVPGQEGAGQGDPLGSAGGYREAGDQRRHSDGVGEGSVGRARGRGENIGG